MKKLLPVLLAVGLLLIGFCIGSAYTMRRFYPATMIVDAVVNDTVYVSTETGLCYAYTGASDEEVGDIMSVLMNSMDTPNVLDDKIVSVRYSGF